MRIEKAQYIGGRLILFTDSDREASELVYGFKPGEYELLPQRKKRSLDANGFLWALCTEISEKLRSVTKEEVYRDAIKHKGIYKDFHLCESEAKTLMRSWEMLGTGWVSEKVDYDQDRDNVIIRCYYGSSIYDTRQMSRLIDWLCDEAENLGIHTDDGRISALLEEWDAKAQANAGN